MIESVHKGRNILSFIGLFMFWTYSISASHLKIGAKANVDMDAGKNYVQLVEGALENSNNKEAEDQKREIQDLKELVDNLYASAMGKRFDLLSEEINELRKEITLLQKDGEKKDKKCKKQEREISCLKEEVIILKKNGKEKDRKCKKQEREINCLKEEVTILKKDGEEKEKQIQELQKEGLKEFKFTPIQTGLIGVSSFIVGGVLTAIKFSKK